MRFEQRELTSYAQPVATESLKEGELYFSLQYADGDMTVPIMETLVFVGRNLDRNDSDLLYFQDVESYLQGVRYGSAGAEKAEFQLGRKGKMNHIFEFENALNELMKCSLRRRRTQ